MLERHKQVEKRLLKNSQAGDKERQCQATVAVNVFSFPQCFDTTGWVSGRHPAIKT